MKTNSLSNKTLIYTIGNFATKGLSFLLVFFTTFYLSKEEVGELDLFLTTLSLLTPIFTLQLTDSILRWIIENNSIENQKKVLTNSVAIVTIVYFILFFVFLFSRNFINYLYWNYLFALIFFQSYYLLFQQFQRAIKDNKGYVISSIFYTLFYVSISLFFLTVLNYKIEGLLMANILSSIASLIFIFFRNKIYRILSFSNIGVNLNKELLKFSLPLVPNNLSWWAISSANRYFILYFLGVSVNGIFAISFKFPTLLLMVMNIFYLAWQEQIVESINKANKEVYYNKILKKYIIALFLFSINLLAFNKVFLKHFVDESFFEAWHYTSILILAIVFNALSGFYGTFLFGLKNSKTILSSSLISGIIVVVLSYFLIPHLELYGASISILTGYVVLFLIRVFQIKKYLEIIFPTQLFFTLLIIFVGLLLFESLDIVYGEYILIAMSIIFSGYFISKFLKIK